MAKGLGSIQYLLHFLRGCVDALALRYAPLSLITIREMGGLVLFGPTSKRGKCMESICSPRNN